MQSTGNSGSAGGSGGAATGAASAASGGGATSSVRSSGSTFSPRALTRTESEPSRLAERWAPESSEALRQPSLRALGFVDRLLAPQRTFAEGSASSRAAQLGG